MQFQSQAAIYAFLHFYVCSFLLSEFLINFLKPRLQNEFNELQYQSAKHDVPIGETVEMTKHSILGCETWYSSDNTCLEL